MNRKTTHLVKILVFAVIPIIFVILGSTFDRAKYSTDPESAYLINGLNIATRQAIGHTDNPGTPVQTLSAAVIITTYMFKPTNVDIQTDVLTNSEKYIEIIRYVLIAFSAITIFLLGFFGHKFLKNYFLAITLQLSAFASITIIEELYTKVAPEPLLFVTTSVLILLSLKTIFSSDAIYTKSEYLIYAMLIGFGIANKFIFAPLLVIPFILLQKKFRFKYLVWTVIFFVLFTLPAIKSYPHMIKWVISLATHTGTYGQGSVGIIDFGEYSSSLVSIFKNNSFLTIITVLSVVWLLVLLFTKKYKSSSVNKLLFAFTLASILNILLIAKHYHNNHYLFPCLSLMTAQLVVLFLSCCSFFKLKEKYFAFIPTLITLVAVILVIPKATLAKQGYKATNISTGNTQNIIETQYPDYTVFYYYPVALNEYTSLRWGNVYARRKQSEKLMELFPEGLFFHSWENKFQFWDTDLTPQEVVEKYGKKILLAGGPINQDEFDKIANAGISLTQLHIDRGQAIYKINIKSSPYFDKREGFNRTCDFENIDTQNNKILFSDSTWFCSAESLSQQMAKSGKNSIIVNANNGYAMDHILTDFKPGDTFTIKGWFCGNNPDAYIVAADDKNNDFYFASTKLSNNNEWQETSLNFVVPDDYDNSYIKIYLWNKGNEAIHFDDLIFIKN